MNHSMNSFRRAYLASLAVFGFFAIGTSISSLSQGSYGIGIATLVAFGTALIPALAKGGVSRRPCLALGIASSLTIAFGILFYAICDLLTTTGLDVFDVPIAGIVALVLVAFLFFCPWLLTSIRGLSAVRNATRDQQAAASDGDSAPV